MTQHGRRDTFVTFQRRETTQDPVYGTAVEAGWMTFSHAWAEVQDVLPSRAEAVTDGIDIARRPARIRIDYMDGWGLTSSMRILIPSDGFSPERILRIIAGPAQKGRRDEWEFVAEELSTDAEASAGAPAPPGGALNFAVPANSGLLALLLDDIAYVETGDHQGALNFSDPANSGLISLMEFI